MPKVSGSQEESYERVVVQLLMSIRNVNKTSMRACCKDCMYGNGGHDRKSNRRHVKRSERQYWRSEVRNYS